MKKSQERYKNLQIFSIWLIPAPEEYNILQSLINQLAKDYDAVSFEPHITLISGYTDNIDFTVKDAASEAEKNHSLELDLSSTGCCEGFFRTLFFDISISKELSLLYHDFEKIINKKKSYVLKPHISLLYKDTERKQLEKLRNKIDNEKCFDKIKFNRIKTAYPLNIKEQWHDVESWKTSAATELI